MIQANEIRIGNILYSNLTRANFRVIAEDIVNISKDPGVASPVALESEILEKCGFKFKNSWPANGGELEVDQYILDKLDAKVSSTGGIELSWRDKDIDDIEYLHKLQNLYFALTGNELPITL